MNKTIKPNISTKSNPHAPRDERRASCYDSHANSTTNFELSDEVVENFKKGIVSEPVNLRMSDSTTKNELLKQDKRNFPGDFEEWDAFRKKKLKEYIVESQV